MPLDKTGFQIERFRVLIEATVSARDRKRAEIHPEEIELLDYVMDHRGVLLSILYTSLQGQAEKETTLEEKKAEEPINTDLSAQLRWMTDYIIEEKFPNRHLAALKTIISLFNYNENSEREVFEFVGHIRARYMKHGGQE